MCSATTFGDEGKVMSVHGKISQFIPSQESWSSYTERLEYYFIANDVQDPAKKKAILLTVCGPSTFQLLKNLLQPNMPESKAYTDLVDLLSNHLNPTSSVIMQRFKFNTRTRKDTESVAIYVAELKRLGEHCEFGDKLNEMVRDRLVCGVNDIRIQNRLLQESKLTYDKAFELAQSVEVAAKNAADLLKGSSTHNTTVVQHLHSKSPPSTTFRRHVSCYRCGGNHLANCAVFRQQNAEPVVRLDILPKSAGVKIDNPQNILLVGLSNLKTDLLDPQRKLMSTP